MFKEYKKSSDILWSILACKKWNFLVLILKKILIFEEGPYKKSKKLNKTIKAIEYAICSYQDTKIYVEENLK